MEQLAEWVRVEVSASQAVLSVWTGRRWEPVLVRMKGEALEEAAGPLREMVRALLGIVDGFAARIVGQAELLTARAQGEAVPPAGPEFAAWLARDVEARPDGSAVVAGRELTASEAARLAYHLLLAGRDRG